MNIKIPQGHQMIMPYLMLKGARMFGEYVRKVFTGELRYSAQREGTDKIIHAEVNVGGSTIMFCDATDEWKQANANLFIYVADADEVYKKALGEGSSSVMEPRDEPYGRTCGVCDPFGNTWWITSAKETSGGGGSVDSGSEK